MKMGYELYRRGANLEAAKYFQQAAGSLPLLADHALFYLGESMRRGGDPRGAATAFATLVRDHQGSVYARDAVRRLAEQACDEGKWNEADRWLKKEMRLADRRGRVDEWTTFLKARVAHGRGDLKDTRRFVRWLWIENAGGVVDEEVGDWMARHGVELSEEEWAERAARLTRVAQASKALQIYQDHFFPSGTELPALGIDRIRALIKAGRLDEAQSHAVGLMKDPPARDEGRLLLVKIYARQDRMDEAIGALDEAIRFARTAAERRLFRRKRASLLIDAGRYKEGAKAHEDLAAEGRRGDQVLHLWWAGWGYYQAGELDRAWEIWAKGADRASRPLERARFLFWQARVRERQMQENEAGDLYCRAIASGGWSYYGLQAVRRKGSLPCPELVSELHPKGGNDARRSEEAFLEVEAMGLGNHGMKMLALARLELDSMASREVEEAAREVKGSPTQLERLAWIGQSVGSYHLSMRVAASFYHVGVAGLMPVPTEGSPWRLAFPRAYFEEVRRCRDAGIEPAWIWALMRQESSFRPHVVSPSHAVGLMQLIPPTAREMAEGAHLTPFMTQDLFDPATNIRLACRYVAGLKKMFGGEKAYMAAAYNAGEDAVASWLKRRRGLPIDEFVEEIPFAETNDYVKKVLANYWTYVEMGR